MPVTLPDDRHASASASVLLPVQPWPDRAALQAALSGGDAGQDVAAGAALDLFAAAPVYVPVAHLRFMAELIAAIERAVALPAWQERVLSYAPSIARHGAGCEAGVFSGYDFHLGEAMPQLIEINTNAGGGLLNARLLRAQTPGGGTAALEDSFVAMFRQEWQQARDTAPLRCVAIVDVAPESQFLAFEFELFRRLFAAHGLQAMIADPRQLSFVAGRLRCGEQSIDLVYNRLTDFSLADPANAALRAAYLADAVVLTPHPRAHALYADKRNLVTLSDAEWLQASGLGAADCDLLRAGVPPTREVTPENAAFFWDSRKQWFFKPFSGYGSKAAYRGDKLTTRVFSAIAQGGYVAQALVRPSEQRVRVDGLEQALRFDVRNYAYRGEVQLVSARLYQGQTTNFRTPGGGFAAVVPQISG